jgi:glycosyltransferase involved in cell wall biosynthesis
MPVYSRSSVAARPWQEAAGLDAAVPSSATDRARVHDPMKHQTSICFVMEWHPDRATGGAEIQAWLLAQTLAQRGWRVHYVSEYDVLPEPGAVCRGVHLHGLKTRSVVKKAQLDVLRYPAFSRLLAEIDADVYYQRFAHPYTGMVSLFARSHHKRFVWASAHEMDFERNAFTTMLRRSTCSGLAKLGLLWISMLNDRLYDFGVRNADTVLVQADEHQRLLKTRFGKDSVVLRNGHAVPDRLGPKETPPIVLWLASLKRWKHPEVFVDLARRCQGLGCRFVLAGQTSDQACLADVLRQMEGLANVEYVGGVTFEESNDWIDRCSLFVNTSDQEGFPNTFIQAWLRGVPVVSLNVDPDDVLTREAIGLKSGTPENLSRDVSRLVEDAALRDAMGQRARSYAVAHHSIDAVADRFVKVIQPILDS